MGRIVQDDRPFDLQLLQSSIQRGQCTLRIIHVAPTLVDGYIHILGTEVFDQVQNLLVPIIAEDKLVVPVNAGNEYPLAFDIGNIFVSGGLASAS